ncbi:linoleate 13S-lipoxygenase 3-1, chloroplastic-like [Silene latifolia]|uniref:linoleate 13S-lipoxygenase 3-1, chloroplastic-like n=1 Tax=Silene latifolia TaxID=37657 RepID=UPI003D788FE7
MKLFIMFEFRGIAVPNSTQPHGLRLLIKDYLYAADGLLIWDAITKWVRDYVTQYYTEPSLVAEDRELQSWYDEAVRVGHADFSNASWWPDLKTPKDLTNIMTILIWLASAHHAALNFGQYPYGGYAPNRPVLMRHLIPDVNDSEYACFLADPQKFYFTVLPSVLQTSKFVAVIDTLSTHSQDEEYFMIHN